MATGLDWHYGPTAEDPDPGAMWHAGCGGRVDAFDGMLICDCGASVPAEVVAVDAERGGKSYLCWYCDAPIIRGDRCVCGRGWFVKGGGATMKLEDWPIWINSGYGEHWYECFLPVDGDDGPNCYGTLPGRMSGDTLPVETTLGDLARSIAEHAREEHGVELERSGSWYESYTPDGKLWCGSSNVDDFTAVDTEGMEEEELEHWTKHNKAIGTLTYRRIDSYIVDVLDEGWKPDGDAPAT